MGWHERVELYKKIEEHRKRPLVVYVTSKRQGIQTVMSTDALPFLIEQIDALPSDAKAMDFLIVSDGGDPMVAWRIMTLIRQRVDQVAVLIPQSAYSAATLVAFGADKIIMHPNGHLGPVDMQVRTFSQEGQPKNFSTEEISAFLDFVRETLRITDQEHIRILFEMTCKEVGSLGIGFTSRTSKLAIDLGESLLALHMKDDESRSKLRSIVSNMSRKFQSHAYPVSRKEAADLGLPVNDPPDQELDKLMWDVWLDLEAELEERTPFDPVFELLKNGEASKILLAPVPQLDVPLAAPSSAHWQSGIKEVLQTADKSKVPPVPFVSKRAFVESRRFSHAYVTRGQILSCRTPDMVIRYSFATTSSQWEPINGKKP
jgi:hypothetical protein